MQQVIHSDSANVARHQGLSEDIVWSMVEYMGAKKVDIDAESVAAFWALMKLRLRKGHKDFVVVLSDLDTHTLIGMASARTPCRY